MKLSNRSRRSLFISAILVTVVSGLAICWLRAGPARRPTVILQTPGPMSSIQLTPDGRLVMSADHKVIFRDAVTGKVVRQWPSCGGRIALSRDGTRVVEGDYSTYDDAKCILRDATTGRVLREWPGWLDDVTPDLSFVVVSGESIHRHNGRVDVSDEDRVINTATGRVIGCFVLDEPYPARFTPDDRFLCVARASKPSDLFRLPDMAPALKLPPLAGLAVSPDDSRAFGLSADGTLHSWSLPGGRQTSIRTGLSSGGFLYTLRDGYVVASGLVGPKNHRRRIVQIRTPDGAGLLHVISGYIETVSPDGRFLAMTDGDATYVKTVNVVEVKTGRTVARLDIATDTLGNATPIESGTFEVALAQDGRHVAFGSEGGLLRLYDLTRPAPPAPRAEVSNSCGRAVLSFDNDDGSGAVRDAVALPGGGVAASGGSDITSDDREVKLRWPGKGVQGVKAVVGNGDVSRLGLSPDGRTLVGSSEWGIWSMDLATGRTCETPITVAKDGSQYYNITASGEPVWPAGPREAVCTISSGVLGAAPLRITKWDSTGREIGDTVLASAPEDVKQQNSQTQVEYKTAPDGHTIALLWTGMESTVELRDLRTGKVLRRLLTPGGSPFQATVDSLGLPAFSAKGTQLAIADNAGVIHLWDTSTGLPIGRMSGSLGTPPGTDGDQSAISALTPGGRPSAILAFSPDGQLLAAGRNDGTIYLYSMRTFLPVAQIGRATSGNANVPSKPVWMAFDATGRTLYYTVQNGSDVFALDVPKLSP